MKKKRADWYAKSSRKHNNNFEVRLAEAKYLVKKNEADFGANKARSYFKKMA